MSQYTCHCICGKPLEYPGTYLTAQMCNECNEKYFSKPISTSLSGHKSVPVTEDEKRKFDKDLEEFIHEMLQDEE